MASLKIHPSALVDSGAELGDGCEVGPYCVVGPRVRLGPGCRLHSHVIVDGLSTIGANNEFYPFACIGLRTQDLKYVGGRCYLEIGADNVFREHVTVHTATGDGLTTRIGAHNNFLAYAHVAHDCVVGNHVVFSNNGTLAGHVTVEDHAIVGVVWRPSISSVGWVACRSSAAVPRSSRMCRRICWWTATGG